MFGCRRMSGDLSSIKPNKKSWIGIFSDGIHRSIKYSEKRDYNFA